MDIMTTVPNLSMIALNLNIIMQKLVKIYIMPYNRTFKNSEYVEI